MKRWLLLALILGLAPGCTVGPDYAPPEPTMPDAWHQELTKNLAAGKANLETWWKVLSDPVLNRICQ